MINSIKNHNDTCRFKVQLGLQRSFLNEIKMRSLKYVGHAVRNPRTDPMSTQLQGKVEGKRGRGRPLGPTEHEERQLAKLESVKTMMTGRVWWQKLGLQTSIRY